ncbi:MAG TPA: hypothetical protein VE646_04750 [Actinomycetota bacterium]|nr:hypothetical protein [Actinomycetota bacterium]
MSDPARERIRVAIAGRIYRRPTLVRRFLEDDGFDVVDISSTLEGTLAALAEQEPDAVVVGEGMSEDLANLRSAAPEARIVVMGGAGSPGPIADAHLPRGAALARLTAALRAQFDRPEVAPSATRDGATSEPGPAPSEDRTAAARMGGLAAALTLVVAVALGVVGGPLSPTGIRALAPSIIRPIGRPAVASPLDLAQRELTGLADALGSGDDTAALTLARSLMDHLAEARSAGLNMTGIEGQVRAVLRPLLADVSPGVLSALRAILGDLLAPFPTPVGGGVPAITRSSSGGSVAGPQPTAPTAGPVPGPSEGSSGVPVPSPSPEHTDRGRGVEPDKPPKGGWHGGNPRRQGPKDRSHGHGSHGSDHARGQGRKRGGERGNDHGGDQGREHAGGAEPRYARSLR